MRLSILLGLVLVQTVCQSNEQKTVGDKELSADEHRPSINRLVTDGNTQLYFNAISKYYSQ